MDLASWLTRYAGNRYGSDSPELAGAWHDFRRSVYSSFTPHPSFGWQQMGFTHGSAYRGTDFINAAKRCLAVADQLEEQPNYRDDAVEVAAIALALRADDWFVAAREAHSAGDDAMFRGCVAKASDLLLQADRLLASHSYLTLDYWLGLTRQHGGSDADRSFWESNAKHIITTWGPPVNDYSCRLWSGLIRDLYVPRIRALAEAMSAGQPFDRNKWEAAWMETPGVSFVETLANPCSQARDLVREAYATPLPKPAGDAAEVLGTWSPANVTVDWKQVEWPLDGAKLGTLGGVRFQFTSGNHRLDIREVSIVADGKVVATDRHEGEAGDIHRGHIYRFNIPKGTAANNTLVLRAEVRSLIGAQSNGKVFAVRKSR